MTTSRRRGFSLLELVIAVAILVVLAGVITPGVIGAIRGSERNRALHDLASVKNAYQRFGEVWGLHLRETYVFPIGHAANGNNHMYSGLDLGRDYWLGEGDHGFLLDRLDQGHHILLGPGHWAATPAGMAAGNIDMAVLFGPFLQARGGAVNSLAGQTANVDTSGGVIMEAHGAVETPVMAILAGGQVRGHADPWGNPYYAMGRWPDAAGEEGVLVILSAGPDGVFQTVGLAPHPSFTETLDENDLYAAAGAMTHDLWRGLFQGDDAGVTVARWPFRP
ncbi:MAG: prepilin-type N-terminal cleavage/methylation domain-containing protein [Planctomycetes bacterium]|nr:prepilin-type N-terminal cleavage/methylation domain-containing protein [Planctomycetota bacterium]